LVNHRIPIETRVLKGAALAKRLRAEIAAARLLLAGRGLADPVLSTLLVGSSGPALAYRSSIDRTFNRVGIEHRHVELPATTSPDQLVDAVGNLNSDPEITGILVLMPLPDHLEPHLILEHLSPLKDVDGITPTNAGRLHLGLPSLRPSTPAGGLELLDFHGVQLEGARITVIGRSNVVGRPLATLLTQRHATVTLCHRRTVDLAAEVRRAEIVCIAAGSPGLVTGKMVAPGAVVLDFGVNVVDEGRIVGDAHYESLLGIAAAVTPVPGGTGPVTALVLARNTLAAGFASLRGNLDHVLFELPEEMVSAAELAAESSASHPRT
jgi:methylenetetrahydrofolate dehydrogenase (NADP+) / methenyltetrahydrofolate cyclohydrolase